MSLLTTAPDPHIYTYLGRRSFDGVVGYFFGNCDGINTAYFPLDPNKNLGSCLGPREAISQSDIFYYMVAEYMAESGVAPNGEDSN
ncbi:hypothetical protein ACN38_g9126 [Penicillium nordicum]|uniref:Uncharacterized protein n=1 Tax=Penicillium nordicum TaxID=229535 RepID=A0A0M9WCU3_9EURO|nr:hypothetical protein ACN38_g9126 [Penicillium nordicum]